MGKGIIFDRFLYPAFINLDKNDFFDIKYKGELYSVLLIDHINATHIYDFENEITINYSNEDTPTAQLDKSIVKINADTPYITELGNKVTKIIDYSGENEISYNKVFTKEPYTDILIAFEVQNLESALKKNNAISIEVLNYFLSHYKDIAKQADIKSVEEIGHRDIIFYRGHYSYQEKDKGKKFTDVLNGEIDIEEMKPFGFKTTPNHPKTQTSSQDIKNFLEYRLDNNLEIDETQYLLNKAASELFNENNPKYAFLDIFIALESYITNLISKYKHEVIGISKTKIKDHKKDLTISYILDIELHIIFNKDFSKEEKDLINKVKGLATKRNNIVHEKKNITFEEARDALIETENFIEVFNDKFNTKFFDLELQ